MQTLLSRAAEQLTAQVEDNWKQDNLIQAGSAQLLPVSVPVRGLSDWVKVRDRLNGVAVVRRADVVLLRRDQVRLNLRSEEHTSELQSHHDLVCRLLLGEHV